jgi:hypothetical protein
MSLNRNISHDEHRETHPPSTPIHDHLSPPSSTTGSDDHILIVDWDGPDDPENPRKYARRHFPRLSPCGNSCM